MNDFFYINLQRVDWERLPLLRALVGQLNKLNDGGGLFPLDCQLCSFSDARREVLVQLDVGPVFIGRPSSIHQLANSGKRSDE